MTTYNTDKLISSQLVQTDTRGRNYPDNPNSGQGGYSAKAMLRGPREYQITKDNVEYLVITFNSLVDGNFITEEEILPLYEEFTSRIRHIKVLEGEEQATAKAELVDWLKDSYDAKPRRLAKAFTYARDLMAYLRNPASVVKTRVYIFVDAKTNAIQHMANVCGNRQFLQYGGLAGAPAVDAYTSVGTAVQQWLMTGAYKEAANEAVRSLKPFDYVELPNSALRKIFKAAVMTYTYGAGQRSIKKGIRKAAKKFAISSRQVEAYAVVGFAVLKGFFKSAFEFVGGNKLVATDTKGLEGGALDIPEWLSGYSKAFDKDSFTGFSYRTSEGGYKVFRARVKSDKTRYDLAVKGASGGGKDEYKTTELDFGDVVASAIKAKTVSLRNSTTSAVPDVIHALDGAVMRLLFVELDRLGVNNVHHIHDCVAVQLGDVETTLEAFRMAIYGEFSASGYNPLAYIASQRAEELRLSKPATDSEEFGAWEAMRDAALEAVRSATSATLLIDEQGNHLSVSDLMADVHQTAFEAE